MKRHMILFICLFFTAALPAFSSDYVIISFTSGGRNTPPSSNEGIAPLPGNAMLRETEAMPALAPGEVVLRRRYGAEVYRLYKGVFAKDAFSPEVNLFTFDVPVGMTLAEFARFKFNADHIDKLKIDLPTMYFNNTHV
jgi:hypothetical protein